MVSIFDTKLLQVNRTERFITNSLRLLNLPEQVLRFVEQRKISSGHAKILVGLENALSIANKIIEKNLSVRQTENFVKIFRKKQKPSKLNKDLNVRDLELSISSKIGLKVDISNKKK